MVNRNFCRGVKFNFITIFYNKIKKIISYEKTVYRKFVDLSEMNIFSFNSFFASPMVWPENGILYFQKTVTVKN